MSAVGMSAGIDGVGMRGLRVRGITVQVGPAVLVDDASLDAPAGSLTALVGPNGAGKSTLLRAIAGVGPRRSGTASIDGVDLATLPRRERARRIALVEQDARTELPLTARDVVRLGRTPHEAWLGGGDPDGAAAVEAALERAGATALADRELPTLSGGERQRVLVARALAQRSPVLLLDEPTTHLDVAAQLDLMELLRSLAAEGFAVLAALHELPLAAEHADRVVALRDGRVVAEGAPRDVLVADRIAELYGDVDATWVAHPSGGSTLVLRRPAR